MIAVEVTTLSAYETFQRQLRELDFSEDLESGVICRWQHVGRGIILDAVPVNERLAGFSGGWLPDAVADPAEVRLPSGLEIRAVRPPWLIATKIEAFLDRGASDCLSSQDFEDIVTLVDARDELFDEIPDLPTPVRRFIADRLAGIVALPTFVYGVEGALPGPDRARADVVVSHDSTGSPRSRWPLIDEALEWRTLRGRVPLDETIEFVRDTGSLVEPPVHPPPPSSTGRHPLERRATELVPVGDGAPRAHRAR